MKTRYLALAALFSLAACGSQTPQAILAQPVPTVAIQDSQTALATYQAALGVAQVALINNPGLATKVSSLAAKAAPYIDLIQKGVVSASAAPNLSMLAAQMLIAGAAYITVVPSK